MIGEQNVHISPLASDVLGKSLPHVTSVGQLEQALLSIFPAEDAESWDKTGLLVGDRHETIQGVACALDASLEAIRLCRECGSNVLVTHHPAFLEAPLCFGPSDSMNMGSGRVVWEAIRSGVALMNFHTALDVSPLAQAVLPGMLKLGFEKVLAPINETSDKGYGQVCSVQEEALTLGQLAARCVSVFGRIPRVYGDQTAKLRSVVTCTGSASDLPQRCVAGSIDALVCGEIRYHSALEASACGLGIVELGHDVSELPLSIVLAQVVAATGLPEDSIHVLDQGHTWWTPETLRQ